MSRIQELAVRFQIAAVLIATASYAIFCQGGVNTSASEYLTPMEEEFKASSDVVGPWRNSGCFNRIRPDLELDDPPPCTDLITSDESTKAHILAIYNDDASVWYRFSIGQFRAFELEEEPKHFVENPKEGFVPFVEVNLGHPFFILRIVRESPHWYEVEINEKTQETKYVLKNDKAWERMRWDFWLFLGHNILLKEEHRLLYDKPGGTVIEETRDTTPERVKFLKMDGDWALVSARLKSAMELRKGWVRWRKGRDILVGCHYNNFFGSREKKYTRRGGQK